MPVPDRVPPSIARYRRSAVTSSEVRDRRRQDCAKLPKQRGTELLARDPPAWVRANNSPGCAGRATSPLLGRSFGAPADVCRGQLGALGYARTAAAFSGSLRRYPMTQYSSSRATTSPGRSSSEQHDARETSALTRAAVDGVIFRGSSEEEPPQTKSSQLSDRPTR